VTVTCRLRRRSAVALRRQPRLPEHHLKDYILAFDDLVHVPCRTRQPHHPLTRRSSWTMDSLVGWSRRRHGVSVTGTGRPRSSLIICCARCTDLGHPQGDCVKWESATEGISSWVGGHLPSSLHAAAFVTLALYGRCRCFVRRQYVTHWHAAWRRRFAPVNASKGIHSADNLSS